MNKQQMYAAKQAMIEWLEHPSELGKTPYKIECTQEFDLYDLHYYIFKFKKNILSSWLLGVCGGYEEGQLEHCGHIFSEMKEYHQETEVKDAIALVEMIRSYRQKRASKAEKKKENPGTFLGFVLLDQLQWDKEAFLENIYQDWQIENLEDDSSEDQDFLIMNNQGCLVSACFMPSTVPNEEVEYQVQKNYMWKDGINAIKKQQAHLIVCVIAQQSSAIEAGKMFVKLLCTCCRDEHVIGIYASDTVFQPELYLYASLPLKRDELPLINLVWIGLYSSKQGICGYTYGMHAFGKDEIEVIDTQVSPQQLHRFLYDIALYVIENDEILNDGETIGMNEDEKFLITRSQGIAVEGMSLKIKY